MIEITQITLKLDDHELSLTVEEARQVYRALDDLFGERRDVPIPYTPPPYPIYPTWRYTWGYTDPSESVNNRYF